MLRHQFSSPGRADLHVHSTASDGKLTPAQLVDRARRLGVAAVGLCDHDTTAGQAEAMARGAELGVMVVPGVELSAECNGCEVHVLGYFADNARLEPVLADLRAQRVVRARQMLARLRRLGIAVTWEQVLAETAGAAPGRPHLARTLVTLGYAGSVSEAFERYLSPGRPAYVPRQRLAPAAAVRLVRAGGGVAVLAHPGLGVPDRLLPELLAAGLQGVEVYYPGHSPADVCHYLRWAADRRLVVTGGSDFHGPGEREGAEVGSATVPVAVCRQLAELAGRQPPD